MHSFPKVPPLTGNRLSGNDDSPHSSSFSPSSSSPFHSPQASLADDLTSIWRRTKCLNCGHVHEGTGILTSCPKCGNTDADKFEEAE